MVKGLDPLFDGKEFDLVVAPQDSQICVLPMASGTSNTGNVITSHAKTWNLGYPMATMPLGTLDHLGRPFSLAVIAKAGKEDLIFQFLSAFEATFPKRVVPPQLVRSTNGTNSLDEAEL